jgi:UDP-N-acetyl-D-mannosaminuronic acid dehydrogenase
MECRKVLCTDPYVPDPELTPLPEVLDKADLLIVGTPHDCYRGLKFRQPVIDITATIKDPRAERHDPGTGIAPPHF